MTIHFYFQSAEMKIELDTPTWYSKESMYSALVKNTDITLDSEPVDLSKENQNINPSLSSSELIRVEAAKVLTPLLTDWFTTPLTYEQIEKRLKIEFQPFHYKPEQKWVKMRWIPKYFQVQKKGFFLLFQVSSFVDASPRIPLAFLDEEMTTPKANTSTEDNKKTMPANRQVRNIVIQADTVPTNEDLVEMIPFSEHQNSLELRDEHTRDRHRLRQAQLKAAIARLKVEEMKERYLRQYGEYVQDSSESEEDSEENEFSDTDSKK